MSNNVEDINIKNWTYYFFNDIINIESFAANNIKVDEKSNKNILIYYIGYLTIKDSKYVEIHILSSIKWLDTLNKLMEISI